MTPETVESGQPASFRPARKPLVQKSGNLLEVGRADLPATDTLGGWCRKYVVHSITRPVQSCSFAPPSGRLAETKCPP